MIKTLGELLERLRRAEADLLNQQDISHPPTIGGMYEGLTKAVLNKAIPPDSGVDVSAGFLTDDTGQNSDELDCLVVTAPGKEVPYTDKKIFHINDVVAVIQVKKNLYSKELRSGHENLASVNALHPNRDREGNLFKHAYQATTLRPVPGPDEWKTSLPYALRVIYYTLAMEVYYPARIVLGYDGFKTQTALRESFYRFITGQLDKKGIRKGLGIQSLPNLICCGEHSLIKNNGIPFCAPLDDEGYWPALASTSMNPTELILELIWTRLVYAGKLPGSIFDDDYYYASMNRLLDARPLGGGWEYRFANLPKEFVDAPPKPREWSPAFIDETQLAVLSVLARQDSLDLGDQDLIDFLGRNGYTPARLVKSLNQLRLAGEEHGHLVLITSECQCILLPDGRIAAADNRAGELTRWHRRHFAR